MPKYKNRKNAALNVPLYDKILDKKKRKFLTITRTITFDSLKDVNLPVITTHIWITGDTLYKLSYKYYDTYDFWWVIALVNNKPSDAHYTFGDEVLIPANPSVLNNKLES